MLPLRNNIFNNSCPSMRFRLSFASRVAGSPLTQTGTNRTCQLACPIETRSTLLHAATPMDTSWDEYDAYDLSEFTASDFVHIDSNTTGATTRRNDRATAPEEEQVVGTGRFGGLPQVAVELELGTDESVVVKVAGGGESTVIVDGASRRSPFEEFRSQTLSVSDLVGPAWYIPPSFPACDGLIVC